MTQKKLAQSNVKLIRTKATKQANSLGENAIIDGELDTTPPQIVAENPDALEVWNSTIKSLNDARITKDLDKNIFTLYCVWWSRWLEAEAEIDKVGLVCYGEQGAAYQHPMVSIAKQASEKVVTLGARLGLSPRDRNSLKIQPIKKDSGLFEP